MEDVKNTGLSFRGHPLEIRPINLKKWVTIRRLPYGTPHEFVQKALSPYGTVVRTRSEVIDLVATGTIFALMDIKGEIPSKLMIHGHTCHVWHRDQIRTCFRCNEKGHQTRQCPSRRRARPGNDNPAPRDPPSAQASNRQTGRDTPSESPPRSPCSYAAAVASGATEQDQVSAQVSLPQDGNTSAPPSEASPSQEPQDSSPLSPGEDQLPTTSSLPSENQRSLPLTPPEGDNNGSQEPLGNPSHPPLQEPNTDTNEEENTPSDMAVEAHQTEAPSEDTVGNDQEHATKRSAENDSSGSDSEVEKPKGKRPRGPLETGVIDSPCLLTPLAIPLGEAFLPLLQDLPTPSNLLDSSVPTTPTEAQASSTDNQVATTQTASTSSSATVASDSPSTSLTTSLDDLSVTLDQNSSIDSKRSASTRKSKRNVPRLVPGLVPFARKKTAPAPVCGTHKKSSSSSKTSSAPRSSPDEVGVTLTSSGNLVMPDSPRTCPVIPNPPYEDSPLSSSQCSES